jgi:periplasmic copper chaperone A
MYVACFRRLLLPLLALCASPVMAELTLSEGWVRAVPPNSRTTAAYFVLRNSGEHAVQIDAVRASQAGAAEMHDWVEYQGMKRMTRLHEVSVPGGGGELVFQPGGKHMMMFRLDPVPTEGESVMLCVTTREGEEVCADAEVRQP